MKQVLLEKFKSASLVLKESTSNKEENPNCLGRLEGICADYKNPTRNGNFYSKKLWENVFNDPLIKESLEDHVLIGELDHPDDRLETKAVNAAIVMTDYKFDDTRGVLLGSFDILPTPQGKILRSLLDYGCKIGVSSRGEGDVTDKDGVSYVDENSFDFVGFDAVVLPAVKSAKPSLQESVSNRKLIKSFKSSILEEIKSATTKAELDLITKVIKSTNLPDTDSLYESVKIKSKELEGSTGSSNLIEDIRQLTNQNQKLKQEVKKLKEGIITNKSSDSKSDFNVALMFEKDELSAKLDEALNQYRRLKIDARNYIKSNNRTISRLRTESRKSNNELRLLESNNKSLQEEMGCNKSEINKSRRELKVLESKNVTLQDEVNRKDNLIKELTESRKDLQLQVTDLKNRLNEAVANYSNMKSNLLEVKKSGNNKIEHLNSLIEAKSRKIDELSSQVRSRDESVEDKSDKIDDLLSKVQNLKEELVQEKSKNNKLADKSTQLNSKLQESVNSNYNNIVKYAEQRVREYGLSRDEVLKSIDQNSTIESVNTLIESIRDRNDRYNKLPITTDLSLNKVTKVASNSLNNYSEEDNQTLLFLNSMYKN